LKYKDDINTNDKKGNWYKSYTHDFWDSRKFHFFSLYYQSRLAIVDPNIRSMLEFGTGRNTTKALVEHFGIKHKSVDFDNKTFCPDEVSTLLDYKDSEKYDVVSAFQMLEHNPLETLEENLLKMKSLSNKYVYVSLPFSGRWLSININTSFLPRIGFSKSFLITWNRLIRKSRDIEAFKKRDDLHNPHWWEIGDGNFSKKDFIKLANSNGLNVAKTFHNEFFPYHVFFLLEIND
jgi:hypothetical protein